MIRLDFPQTRSIFGKPGYAIGSDSYLKNQALSNFIFLHQVIDEVMAASGLTCSAGYRNHSFWRTMYSAVRYESAAIVAVAGYAVNVGKTDAPRMNRLWMSWDWQ